MTTTTPATQARLILCSIIASTTFAVIAADFRGHATGQAAPSSQPGAARGDVPVVQTWAEVTNLPDAGVNTGG